MQKKTRIRRMFQWLLAALIVLIVLGYVVGPAIRSRQVKRAIASFEAAPSQACAARLTHLLETHAATEEQGKHILSLLLRPEIIMRENYPVNQITMVDVEQPFAPDSDLIQWQEETISINGQRGPSRVSSAGPVDGRPCPAWLGAYEQPGTYAVRLRVQGTLGIERAGGGAVIAEYLHRILPGPISSSMDWGWSSARTYKYDFTLTTRVTIVAEDKAERVELTSSPQLDATMRAAFSSASRRGPVALYSTASGDRWVRGSSQIAYRSLPAAMAFKVAIRLPDGRTIEGNGSGSNRFSAGAGESGVVTVSPTDATQLEQPGTYEAKILLTPDPDWAYRNPRIKTLWNGTLEFPLSFHVDANAPPGWPLQP